MFLTKNKDPKSRNLIFGVVYFLSNNNKQLTIDRAVPRSLGGPNCSTANKQPMCENCNNKKGNSYIG
jgi:5-methylcytosine-specific restriction endonuclease McrA